MAPEAHEKIPFEKIQAMLAQASGGTVAPDSITKDAYVCDVVGGVTKVHDVVREGVVALMGQYFEERADEVDMHFLDVASQFGLSAAPVAMTAGVAHEIAEHLYAVLDY